MSWQQIWSGTLAELAQDSGSVSGQFVTGDVGVVALDLTQALQQIGLGGVSSIPQSIVDAINGGVQAVAGWISTTVQGLTISIQFQAQSPTVIAVAVAIIAVTVLAAEIIPAVVWRQVGSTTGGAVGGGIVGTVAGLLGVDDNTARVIIVGVGAVFLLKTLR